MTLFARRTMKLSRIARLTFTTIVLWGMFVADGCSGGAGGSGGTTVPPGSGGTIAIDGGGDTSVASGGTSGGSLDVGTWSNVGVCAEHGESTVDTTSLDGWEDRYIISDSGFGTDAERPCVVRFDLKRVGDAPHASECMDTLSKKCEWTHLVEYSNPQVLVDTDGVCAKSDLALTSDAIATIVGSRVEIGYAREYAGAHGSSRMKYFESMKAWDVAGNASWDTTTNRLTYTFRDGFCNYGP